MPSNDNAQKFIKIWIDVLKQIIPVVFENIDYNLKVAINSKDL